MMRKIYQALVRLQRKWFIKCESLTWFFFYKSVLATSSPSIHIQLYTFLSQTIKDALFGRQCEVLWLGPVLKGHVLRCRVRYIWSQLSIWPFSRHGNGALNSQAMVLFTCLGWSCCSLLTQWLLLFQAGSKSKLTPHSLHYPPLVLWTCLWKPFLLSTTYYTHSGFGLLMDWPGFVGLQPCCFAVWSQYHCWYLEQERVR